jgi:hypothetical protein
MTTIHATIAGIPCLARLTYWEPGDPGQCYGPPERCWEPTADEVGFELLSTSGTPAPDLVEMMSDAEENLIIAELSALARLEDEDAMQDALQDALEDCCFGMIQP